MAFFKLEQGYRTKWSGNLPDLIARAKIREEDWVITDLDDVPVEECTQGTHISMTEMGIVISPAPAIRQAGADWGAKPDKSFETILTFDDVMKKAMENEDDETN